MFNQLSNPNFEILYSIDLEDSYPNWIKQTISYCYDYQDNAKFWTEKNLQQLTDDLKCEIHSYIKAGVIAHNLKITGIWKKTTKNFSDFCNKFLGKSFWQIDRLIAAADVAIKLLNAGFTIIPQNESQCRPLVGLDYDKLQAVWEHCLNCLGENRLTATAISQIVERWGQTQIEFNDLPKTETKVRKELPKQTWTKLSETAKRYGMSPDEYLDLLLEKELGDVENEEETPPEEITEKKPELIESINSNIQKVESLCNKLLSDLENHLTNWITTINNTNQLIIRNNL